jgi:hypothetical protein
MSCENIILIILLLLILFLYMNYYKITEKFTSTNILNKNGSVEYVGVDIRNRMEAQLVVSLVLKQINERTKLIYVLNRVDQIKVETLSCGSLHYIVDVFVHEVRYKITRRLLFDFIVRPNKSIVLMSMNISNAFKYADNAEGVNPNDPIPELILKDWNLQSNYHIEGTDESSIPYSLFSGAVSKEEPLPDKFRNWILPMGIHITDSASFPTRRQGKWWDDNGVAVTDSIGNGLKNTPMRILRYPEFNPTVNMSLTDVSTENGWLFNKARGMVGGFPASPF